MSETTAKHEQRRKLVVRGMLSLLVLVAGFALLEYNFSTPEGMWDAPEIGAEGYSYLEFKDGKVETVTPDKRFPLAEYGRKQGTWFFHGESNQMLRLEPSWFKMRILHEGGREAEPPRIRLFLKPKDNRVDASAK